MVFELTRAGIGLEVAMEVLFVMAAEVFLFDPVDVGKVVGACDIYLALVD